MSTTKVTDAMIDGVAASKLTGALPAISGASLTNLDARDLENALPAISGASLTTLNASNISSGTVADARISESSVTQHVAAVDLTPVTKDISLLALQTAINGNLSAYGLTNSWIEQFEDSTKIENLTNSNRNADNEYISTGTATLTAWPYTAFASQDMAEWGSPAMYDHPSGTDYLTMKIHGAGTAGGAQNAIGWWPSPSGYACGFVIDYLASYVWRKFTISNFATNGIVEDLRLEYSNAASPSSWTIVDLTGASVSSLSGMTSGYESAITITTPSNGVMTFGSPGNGGYAGGTVTGFPSFTARHIRWSIGSFAVTANSGMDAFVPYYDVVSSSATGSFESTDVVPQDTTNKSSVGLVMLYKDQAGTNTLNTDIIAKVRANTGQAYQTLVLAGAGTYSDSLKIAIAPAIAVTAGQALSYQVSFANQSGAKEGRIHGVAMTY